MAEDSSLNLSVGVVPLLTTALELLIILFFLRLLAVRYGDTSFGQALLFIIG